MQHSVWFKFSLYLIAILGFLWVNRIFITDPKLRAWIMQSFEENGRASGKSLAAFAFVMCIVAGWGVAMHYSVGHIVPEFYFWGVLGLITSFYGIKAVNGYVNAKNPTASTTSLVSSIQTNGQEVKQETTQVSTQESAIKELDTPELIAKLKDKYTESGSSDTFEIWIVAQINTENGDA